MMKNDLKSRKKIETRHLPVLLNEVIDSLNLEKGDVVFDGTLGGGGYFKKICEKVGSEGTAIATDQDIKAIKRFEDNQNFPCTVHLINENFRNVDKVLMSLNKSEINGFVLDLGLSSDQFENSGRGFTFKKDEPLLMTFNEDISKVNFTAKDIVNTWDEENIADILYGYADEKFSRRIARAIVENRKKKEIKTTFELVEILEKALPIWYRKGRKTHFATKTFQALRITVNDEIGSLKDGLEKGFQALADEGRMAIVSFHSIEDRVIKRFMKEKHLSGEGRIITKKIITPTSEELKENPRSRSAKLRVIEKTKHG